MKILLLALLGIFALLFGGSNLVDGSVSENISELDIDAVLASALEDISGSWYGFPAGLKIQFADDGSAQFGLDWDGTAIGYAARVWFEGQELSIQFTNYDGQEDACAFAIGQYGVHVHANGAIGFIPIDDDCHIRAEILGGSAEFNPDLIYHPVQD